MNRRTLVVVLCFITGILLVGCQHSDVSSLATGSVTQHLADGTASQTENIPSANKTAKSADTIAEGTAASHKISKQDYSAVYHGLKMRKFPTQDAIAALTAFIAAKNLTQTQKHQVYDLCVAMLSTPYPNDVSGDVKPLAITVLGSMGDKRAVPHLVPLLKAPEDTTRLAAQGALKDLGYPVPSVQSLLY